MYIKHIYDKNIGPIEEAEITFPFNEEGKPKPVIIVGANGSGKSTLLSNIVDAFYVLADKLYTNVMISSNQGLEKQYYKIVSPVEIRRGSDYSLSYIQFKETNNVSYIFKCGKLNANEAKDLISSNGDFSFTWTEKESNVKLIDYKTEDVSKAFQQSIICYFGPDRYEKPFWQGKKYNETLRVVHPTIREGISGILYNPIYVNNVVQDNTQWIVDVIVDSRADVTKSNDGKWAFSGTNVNDLDLLNQAKIGLESILGIIIGKEVYLSLNYRNRNISRLRLMEKNTQEVISPTLDSLSTGQITLFNMFATIVKYADVNDINKSFKLNDISGLVVIDEVELHLHTQLQKEVLPKLIKLFPKVQFVITTHSPLFLLGMQDVFGDDGFDIYNMPDAERIDVENFSEFQKAYDCFKKTITYQREVEEKVENAIRETITRKEMEVLVVTEGATDWKHMKTAFKVLKRNPNNKELFENLEFEFLEYEPDDGKNTDVIKLEMGNSTLCKICENYSKIPQPRKYIFIADRDHDNTNNKLSVVDKNYKSWGNNVYSFILPLPEHRIETPNICVEHLYKDEEIKTEIECDGIKRRLYLGSEFDDRGVALEINRFCIKENKCGDDKNSIIDGSNGDSVTSLENKDNINYALPKMHFANYVAEHPDDFNFDSFLEIFKTIKDIISEEDND